MSDILEEGRWTKVSYGFGGAGHYSIIIFGIHQSGFHFTYYSIMSKIIFSGHFSLTYKKMSGVEKQEFFAEIEREFKITISETNLD